MNSSSRAVIVRNGVILALGCNEVQSTFDLTSHAEIVAIRKACQQLGTSDLFDCQLYTTSHPCPMCIGACQIAQLGAIYYVEDSNFVGSDLYNFLNNCTSLNTRVEQIKIDDYLRLFEISRDDY